MFDFRNMYSKFDCLEVIPHTKKNIIFVVEININWSPGQPKKFNLTHNWQKHITQYIVITTKHTLQNTVIGRKLQNASNTMPATAKTSYNMVLSRQEQPMERRKSTVKIEVNILRISSHYSSPEQWFVKSLFCPRKKCYASLKT